MATASKAEFQGQTETDIRDLFTCAGFDVPSVVSAAPGRVNVIGEHIDYNGGLVLPAAIDKWVRVGFKSRDDQIVRLYSEQNPEARVEFSLSDSLAPVEKCWGNYARGVIAGLREKGIESPGFDAVVSSTVPVGGGLSSSAALEAAIGRGVLRMLDLEMDGLELARLCQKAEHVYANVPCGLMDQAAVILSKEGMLLKLDCLDDSFEHAPFSDPDWALLIINSRVKHELNDGGYAARRDACHAAARILGVDTLREIDPDSLDATLAHPELTEEMQRCVRHAVTEIKRTLDTVAALGELDYLSAGKFMNESHASLRDDYKVSCEELDFIAALVQELPGVAGCRMTGGGFGGSAIALLKSDQTERVAKVVQEKYEEAFGIDAEIFETRPAPGAIAWNV